MSNCRICGHYYKNDGLAEFCEEDCESRIPLFKLGQEVTEKANHQSGVPYLEKKLMEVFLVNAKNYLPLETH